MTPNPLRWTAKLKEMYGRPPYKPDDPDGFNVLLDGYADIARKVARETGAALVDAREAFVAHGRKAGESVDALLLDGMHPNDRGHRLSVYSTPSSYYSPPGSTCIACRVTRDGGRTWTRRQPIFRGYSGATNGAIETRDGRILVPYSHYVSSPGRLARLADGRIALVWNRPEKRRGELHLAFSSDEGRTWAHALVLATGKQVAYPYAIEIDPGSLWIGYHDVPKGWMFPRARHLRVPCGGG